MKIERPAALSRAVTAIEESAELRHAGYFYRPVSDIVGKLIDENIDPKTSPRQPVFGGETVDGVLCDNQGQVTVLEDGSLQLSAFSLQTEWLNHNNVVVNKATNSLTYPAANMSSYGVDMLVREQGTPDIAGPAMERFVPVRYILREFVDEA